MRVYKNDKIKELYCNKCGRELKVENGIALEGVISIDHKWDYFSNKDGIIDTADICEECFEQIVNEFKIPITRKELTELI